VVGKLQTNLQASMQVRVQLPNDASLDIMWGGQNDGGFKPTLPLTSDHGIITAVLILPNEILLLHSSQVT